MAALFHTGTHYVVANAGWNSNLSAGGQVAIGFVAASALPTKPVNYTINGQSLSGINPPPSLPTISVADVSIGEGNSGSKNETFTITLSAAATSNVTMNYATRNDTATAGSDYTATSGKITFAPGQTSKTVNVSVAGDSVFESDEDFFLDLSAPVGATLARGSAMGMVTNDDAPPPPPIASGNVKASVQFSVTNDWTNGFNGDVAICNAGSATIHNWKVQFTFNGQISSIWNGSILSHTGNILRRAAGELEYRYCRRPIGRFRIYRQPRGAAAVLTNFVVTGTVDTGSTGGTSGGTSGETTGSTGSSQSLATSNIAWPTHYYAPYVDSTLWPLYDFVGTARTSGVKFFTLAFITADPANKPAWGGFAAYDVGNSDFDTQMKANIVALRNLGGDVMVSFGGAANQELAQSHHQRQFTHSSLSIGHHRLRFDAHRFRYRRRRRGRSRQYRSALASHRPTATSGRRRRRQARRLVHAAGVANRPHRRRFVRGPIGPALRREHRRRQRHDDGLRRLRCPNPAGHMGDFAIQAATSLFGQLKTAYNGALTDAQLWAKIGMTPMIGTNDIQSEVFTQQDAAKMLAFAQQHGIDRISIWSCNPTNSAIASDYDFLSQIEEIDAKSLFLPTI